MINLKEVIAKYPECLNDSAKLRSYLMDLYPNIKKGVLNVIVIIQECRILNEIQEMNRINDFDMHLWINRIENTYGYAQKVIEQALKLWLLCYKDKKVISFDIEVKEMLEDLICPSCGKQVSETDYICMGCGYPLKECPPIMQLKW